MNKEQQPDPSPPAPEISGETPSDTAPPEKEIDLNSIFPDAETDLNRLFPDADIKQLLKSVNKNKKDLHALKDRFVQENETGEDEEDVSVE